MRNKLVLISLLLAVAVTATAQTKEKYYSEHFKDNIFVSVGFGAQACVNPDNFDYGFSHAVTPVITLSVGKYFSPIWGVRLQGAGAWTTLYSKYYVTDYATGARSEAKYNEFKNKKYVTVHADALFNLSNAINYRPDRLLNVSLFMGPGLTFAKNASTRIQNTEGTNYTYGDKSLKALINGSVGIMGSFNISNFVDINIEARGEVSPSPFGAYSNAVTDGAVSVTAGISYYFGGKKFVTCDKKDDSALDAYIKDLAKAKSDLADAQNALKNQKPVIKEVVKEVVVDVEVAGPRAIFFKIGSIKLDDYNLVNIRLAAKTIKENPDKKYKVAGYADKYTGSAKLNKKLSERRAQAVYDALVKEGVDKGQLEMVGEGGTENMFGKSLLNRVVILEKAE